MEAAISLLRGRADEEKFAGLLLVAKHFSSLPGQSDESADWKKDLWSVFEAVGLQFLRRLLRGSSSEGEALENVAISVLSVLTKNRDVATQCWSLGPALITLLCRAKEQRLQEDCIEVLWAVQQAVPSRPLLSREDAAALAVWLAPDPSSTASVPAEQVRENALNFLITSVAKGPLELTLAALPALARRYAFTQAAYKFELQSALLTLLLPALDRPAWRSQLASPACASAVWPYDVREGLSDVLSSHARREDHRVALLLARTMLELMGQRWATRKHPNPLTHVERPAPRPQPQQERQGREKAEKDEDDEDGDVVVRPITVEEMRARFGPPGGGPLEQPSILTEQQVQQQQVQERKANRHVPLPPSARLSSPELRVVPAPKEGSRPFPSLLLGRLAVEIRVALMDAMRESGRALAGASAEQEHAVLFSCLRLTELAIRCLTDPSVDDVDPLLWQNQPPTTLALYRKRLEEIFAGVLHFIKELKAETSGDAKAVSKHHLLIAYECIQCLGVWLEADTESMQGEVLELLPFLLSLASATESPSSAPLPLPLAALLPALTNLALDEKAARVVLSSAAVARLVSFLLALPPSPPELTEGLASLAESASQVLRNALMTSGPSTGAPSVLTNALPRLVHLWTELSRSASPTTVLLAAHLLSLLLATPAPAFGTGQMLASAIEWLLGPEPHAQLSRGPPPAMEALGRELFTLCLTLLRSRLQQGGPDAASALRLVESALAHAPV